jgi:hypothetical protein
VKPTCFVVMGFGEKTDFRTGRVLNLDKTYKNIIKPAVEAAGVECIRADEIRHTGLIDVPMYEQLLAADVVVADLSTTNANAFYELGVRHALRPYSTIVIAESKMTNPFDVNHLVIRTYEHLGTDIGFDEVMRLRAELTAAVTAVLVAKSSDSPVYAYLAGLQPPTRRAQLAEGAAPGVSPAEQGKTMRTLLDEAEACQQRDDFTTAKTLFAAARALAPKDSFIAQRLAFATYKSKLPNELQALREACTILESLDPASSTDPATLGLWGAVHKRLWEETRDRAMLDTAVGAHEKAFSLKNDWYNGINVAFLLNVRAAESEGPEAIADFVAAQRIRRRVIETCAPLVESQTVSADDRYWLLATIAEAYFGVGDTVQYQAWIERARRAAGAQWMRESTDEQIAKLRKFLERSPISTEPGRRA